jgi:hypothetical protein
VIAAERAGARVPLRLRFARADLHLRAPAEMADALRRVFGRHLIGLDAPDRATRAAYLRIDRGTDDLPAALRRASATIAREAAALNGWRALRAAAIERDGRAMVLSGPSGAGKTQVAAHLMARGWRLLGDDVALIAGAGRVAPFGALLDIDVRAAAELPAALRTAVERSPWATTADDLHFVGVDPADALGPSAWSTGGRVDAVVTLGEGVTTNALARPPAGAAIAAHDGAPFPVAALGRVRYGMIGSAPALHVADRLEAWFGAHAAP